MQKEREEKVEKGGHIPWSRKAKKGRVFQRGGFTGGKGK